MAAQYQEGTRRRRPAAQACKPSAAIDLAQAKRLKATLSVDLQKEGLSSNPNDHQWPVEADQEAGRVHARRPGQNPRRPCLGCRPCPTPARLPSYSLSTSSGEKAEAAFQGRREGRDRRGYPRQSTPKNQLTEYLKQSCTTKGIQQPSAQPRAAAAGYRMLCRIATRSTMFNQVGRTHPWLAAMAAGADLHRRHGALRRRRHAHQRRRLRGRWLRLRRAAPGWRNAVVVTRARRSAEFTPGATVPSSPDASVLGVGHRQPIAASPLCQRERRRSSTACGCRVGDFEDVRLCAAHAARRN